MTSIVIENITKTYVSGGSSVQAVDCADIAIEPGELFFLLGPSGCGKTTLLRMVAGLLEPTSGRILLGGQDVTDMPPQERGTAMVFQNYALWPHMTVQQNVQFGPRMQGLDSKERLARSNKSLAMVQLEGMDRRKPAHLSGGQQQRVALARALAANARCLLLDEPLSNLDARLRQHMRHELRRLVKSSGTTAIYVTHDQVEALSMADRIAVMNAAKVVQVGTPQDLYERPASRFVADFLGEANFIAGSAEPAGSSIKVATAAGGMISTAATNGRGAVTCCVRPERVAIVPQQHTPPAAGEPVSALPARILSCTYLGSSWLYGCRLADGTEWRVSQAGRQAAGYSTGQSVQLLVQACDLTLLTE